MRMKAIGIKRQQGAVRQRPWLVAVALAVAVALWLASGQFGDGGSDAQAAVDTAAAAEPALPPLVQVRQSQSREIARAVEVRGYTEPWSAVQLAAETEGRVVEVRAKPGARVEAGQVLLRIDPRAREQVLAQARAQLAQRQAEAQAAQRLHRQGHLSDTQLAQAQAQLAAAESDAKRAKLDYEASFVKSPIDGRLEARPVEVGDYLKVGTVAARVVQLGRLKLVADITEQQRPQVHTGQSVSLRTAAGEELPGEVHFVASTADDQTRTYRLEVAIDNAMGRAAGESVRGDIVVDTVSAHRLPIGLIQFDDEGELGLLTVSDEDMVTRHEVEIVRTEAAEAWFSGLPPSAAVITRGQGFVSAGQRVRTTPAAD